MIIIIKIPIIFVFWLL